ncbi:sensor histidine kinase [Nonomuraea sp. NPDC004186]|uniref:sensor histidine kinase n=1 Tax=Nonomuraea sp. NPDC049625 TaxID=3155775 RepID=UPI00341F6A6B
MHDSSLDPGPDRMAAALPYLLAALPLGLTLIVLAARASSTPPPKAFVDMALGVAALVLLRWRHRGPWQTALATALATAFSFTALGPAVVAYGSLAAYRRWRQTATVAVVFWLCVVSSTRWSDNRLLTLVYAVAAAVILAGSTLFGLYLAGRRDLAAARQAAVVAAQAQWVEQAKLEERLKIAQEMHDVLAHRISLLAMLAGGLAYRENLSPEQTREAALAIQENAHQSLNELRAVLGTLRREDGLAPPQPTLAHLEALFDEVRAAGQRVEVDDAISCRDALPAQTGRHAYRIVQEALTNARKHAPGSPVTAELGGRPGEGLRIRVSNAAPPGGPTGPGGRLGLVGLAERTRMAGGTLTHAVRDGRFVLDARLPWEA